MPPKPIIVDVKYPRKVGKEDLVEVRVTIVNKGDTGGVFVFLCQAEIAGYTVTVKHLYDYRVAVLEAGASYTASLYMRWRGEKNVYVVAGYVEERRLLVTDYVRLDIEAEEKPSIAPLALAAALPLIAIPLAVAAGRRREHRG